MEMSAQRGSRHLARAHLVARLVVSLAVGLGMAVGLGIYAGFGAAGARASEPVSAAASALSTWSIVSSRNGTVRQGHLVGVSCTSATQCMAVGSYVNSGIAVTLSEAWNGTVWTIEPSTNPAGARGSYFTGVSCRSSQACVAVGYYQWGNRDRLTLAEAWNGKTWTIGPTVDPKDAVQSVLSGVSCVSPTWCVAAGYYWTSLGLGEILGLVETWNGTKWVLGAVADPTGAQAVSLSGVSCTSTEACTAVGRYTNGTDNGDPLTLAERWDGARWAVEPSPNPGGAQGSYLTGVSCTSADWCMAAGGFLDTDIFARTLAEAWNGKSWAIVATPNPGGSGGPDVYLSGVSCWSASACSAVGETFETVDIPVSLAYTWDGHDWLPAATPQPQGSMRSELAGVSCPSATSCNGVGYYSDGSTSGSTELALDESWSGTSWNVEAMPDPNGALSSELSSVSCISPTMCVAVGYYKDNAGTELTLAEVWNGHGWTVSETPNPTGAESSVLTGVSCTSASMCVAVGDTEAPGSALLSEIWNGATWAIAAVPDPSDYGGSLSGVSCSSTITCMAVGYWLVDDSTEDTLAESWNGEVWTVDSTPNPGADSETDTLGAVSCPSPGSCTAIGSDAETYGSGPADQIVEHWNGTTWLLETAPRLTGSELFGVSCPTAKSCSVAGLGKAASFSWDGITWTIESAALPAGTKSFDWSGFSCAPATSCTAVGTYVGSNGHSETLIETWRAGKPVIESSPNVASAVNSYLSAVSCTSSTQCSAVGDSGNSVGVRATLVERSSRGASRASILGVRPFQAAGEHRGLWPCVQWWSTSRSLVTRTRSPMPLARELARALSRRTTWSWSRWLRQAANGCAMPTCSWWAVPPIFTA